MSSSPKHSETESLPISKVDPSKLMEKLGGSINDFLGPENIKFIQDNKVTLLIVFIVAIIFVLVATYGYDTYVKPILNKSYVPNKEFIKDDKDKVINIYFFFTTWCPYCKKARIEWDKFKEEVNKNNLFEQVYEINFKEIDCDKNADLAKKFNIEGYPTIKLEKNGEIYNYDAKPTTSHLMEFLKGSL